MLATKAAAHRARRYAPTCVPLTRYKKGLGIRLFRFIVRVWLRRPGLGPSSLRSVCRDSRALPGPGCRRVTPTARPSGARATQTPRRTRERYPSHRADMRNRYQARKVDDQSVHHPSQDAQYGPNVMLPASYKIDLALGSKKVPDPLSTAQFFGQRAALPAEPRERVDAARGAARPELLAAERPVTKLSNLAGDALLEG